MKKKIVSLLLTLTVMLTMVPTAFAAKTQPLYAIEYNWSYNEDTGEYWLRDGFLVKSWSFWLDLGSNMRFQTWDGKDIAVEEVWFEENGEPSDAVCFQEIAFDDFSTWYIQASRACSGEICVRSGRVVYRMHLETTPGNFTYYDEVGDMWSPVEITEDPYDMVSKFTNKTYGVPGEKKTIEVHLSERIRTWGGSTPDGLMIKWNDEEPVMVAERINGVMVSNGVSVHGVEVSWDGGPVAYITATMPEEKTTCGFYLNDWAVLGITTLSYFDLIPVEPSAAEPVVLADPGLSNFKAVNTYTAGQFADVAASYWGAPNIAKAYELGLMRGTSASYFSPEESVTVAETITMAARLHSIYTTGSENFVQSNIWYQTYVDYCKVNGILKKDFDYNAPAKRSDFAAILAAALPAEALRAVNTVEDGAIPDVSMKNDSAEAIYALYRAGILTGNDASGTFGPETAINRAAAAAILTRMAENSLRRSVTLTA